MKKSVRKRLNKEINKIATLIEKEKGWRWYYYHEDWRRWQINQRQTQRQLARLIRRRKR